MEHSSIDKAECCKCHKNIDPDNGEAPDYSPGDLSGATWTVVCPHCGQEQTVSPSIEWQTWSID